MLAQQGDVRLHHTADGGEITVENGYFAFDPGLSNAAYIALFTTDDYWANALEDDSTNRLTGRTQAILDGLPATSANLVKLERAVLEDLAFLTAAGVADKVEAVASIPALDHVLITVEISGPSGPQVLKYGAVWEAYL